MPELPDVEVFRRYMARAARHRRVRDVEVRSRRIVRGTGAAEVRRRLRGARLEEPRRHGKVLLTRLDKGRGWLVMHFGMTGFLKKYQAPEEEPAHARVVLDLDDNQKLAFDDTRLFGHVDVAADADAYIAEQGLGPDVLSLGRHDFVELLQNRRGDIKSALMDQSLMAGLGNIYSDEVLYQARIHPETLVSKLDRRALERLHATIGKVTRRAVQAGAQAERMPQSWLLPHRKKGAPCPRCGTSLQRRTIHRRSAWLCPSCQKK